MRIKATTRIGHLVAAFGFFVAICSLMLHGVATPKIMAFGTSEIASLSNQYRTNSGLGALALNSQLVGSAQAKAEHMATNNYFAHDSPDGRSPWDFIIAGGYSYSAAGENLALSNQSASAVVTGWYNSPGHKANMMSANFTEVGYGVSFAATFTYNGNTYNNVYLVAAHYGTPLNPQPQAEPEAPVVQQEPVVQPTSANNETPSAEQADQPNESETADAPQSVPSAPAGFVADPENTYRSGALTSIEQEPAIQMPENLTLAGIGGGGAITAIGGTIEVRRLLHHESLLPWAKFKSK